MNLRLPQLKDCVQRGIRSIAFLQCTGLMYPRYANSKVTNFALEIIIRELLIADVIATEDYLKTLKSW